MTPITELPGRVAPDTDRCIVIYPSGGKTSCAWIGLTKEQVASHLYQIADEIVKDLPMPMEVRKFR